MKATIIFIQQNKILIIRWMIILNEKIVKNISNYCKI